MSSDTGEFGGVAHATRRFIRVGDIIADSEQCVILRDGETKRVEPKVMGVLTALAERPGEWVSRAELIAIVWDGAHVVNHAISRAVSLLRAALGEDAAAPVLVETLARRGYRLTMRPTGMECLSPQVMADTCAPKLRAPVWLTPVLSAASGTAGAIAVLAIALAFPPTVRMEIPAPEASARVAFLVKPAGSAVAPYPEETPAPEFAQ